MCPVPVRAIPRNVTDATLEQLLPSKALQELHPTGAAITDDGLLNLEKFLNLRWLVANNTSISDDGLAVLSKIPELRELNVQNSRVSDSGIASISALANLRQLDIRSACFCRRDLRWFQERSARALTRSRLNANSSNDRPAASRNPAPQGSRSVERQCIFLIMLLDERPGVGEKPHRRRQDDLADEVPPRRAIHRSYNVGPRDRIAVLLLERPRAVGWSLAFVRRHATPHPRSAGSESSRRSARWLGP